ncbi:helix-turn-helix transcriptional regulator [Sinorhizobium meliloti]|jgi:transcriptional regulator with XRE-family HTH domain|uniref:helix-turn-helix transcriptional regulator n=1 Tax=Rhizobium meliloti TaxID=382 RepID=UPI0020BE1906|nr:helix-turn-helix transcriptional regulator [Sinorhizobium meliloti]
MDTRTRIAWNLRRIRSSKKITQENLAVDANVDRTAISGIERGLYNPTVDLLDRLAAALAVDVSEFFAEPPPKARPPEPIKAGRKPNTR